MRSGAAPAGSRYADQRPFALPVALDDLRGPTHGTHDVDRHLIWSGRSTFRLDDDRQVAVLYETVLREASSAVELTRWIDGATLVRLWTSLVLSARLRASWETRFPELSSSVRTSA